MNPSNKKKGPARKAAKKPSRKSPKKVSKKAAKTLNKTHAQKSQKGMRVPVLYEDKNMLVVNKPAGLMVHPDAKSTEYTLCDWIIANYPKIQGVGEPSRAADGTLVDRPGIVHRLDRETSGVLVIAKNQPTFEFLKVAFQTRAVQKTYNTVVWGFVKEDKGVIDRPIGRSKSDFRKWSAERFARGDLRPAVTEYKVLKRFRGEDVALNSTSVSADMSARHLANQGKKGVTNIPQQFTLVEAYPKTGRTHQIRVHFKAINHPVVGDALYAPNHPQVLGFERLALHSRKIAFVGPDGKNIEVEASLPKDFGHIFSQISQIPDAY